MLALLTVSKKVYSFNINKRKARRLISTVFPDEKYVLETLICFRDKGLFVILAEKKGHLPDFLFNSWGSIRVVRIL